MGNFSIQEGGNPGYPVRLAMDPGRLILLGETGEFRSLKKRPTRFPPAATSAALDWRTSRELLQEFDGVSSNHTPIYQPQNNADNRDFYGY